MPVQTLIAVDGRSQILHDPRTAQTYYADSWALIHYLTFGPNMKGGELYSQFFSLLQQGMPRQQAFIKVFGDFKTFDESWSRYLSRFAFAADSIPPPPRLDEKSFASRKLSVAETEFELGAFHYAFGDRKTGEDLITAALRDDPKLGAAHEEQAYALFRQGKDDQALAAFSQAYALDGTLYRSLFSKTMLSLDAKATDPAGEAAYQADLQKVTELNPQFAPAFVELAELAIRQKNFQLAYTDSRKAESLEPSRAGYHLLTGRILLASGRGADAAQFARFVAERWIGPDHNEAVELWNAIPPEKRPAEVNLTTHVPEPNEQSATGTVESAHCGEENQPFTLTITKDGKAQTFYRRGNIAWGFSNTFWWGEDHASVCHHLEGKRAVVFYGPGSDNSFCRRTDPVRHPRQLGLRAPPFLSVPSVRRL
jgi:tetratricopeptide (TPR) repeat protein